MKIKSQSRDIFMGWKFQNDISAQVILNITLYWFSFTFSIFVNIISKNLTILMFFLWEWEREKKNWKNIAISSWNSDLCGPGKKLSWQIPKPELTSKRKQVNHSVWKLKSKYLFFSSHCFGGSCEESGEKISPCVCTRPDTKEMGTNRDFLWLFLSKILLFWVKEKLEEQEQKRRTQGQRKFCCGFQLPWGFTLHFHRHLWTLKTSR